MSGTWTPSFYGYDGFGSVRQLTNSTGTVTDTYEYDAFGNIVNQTGTTPNNYLYRGEQFDSDLGLYYLRARYYNPATGRFLSRDPEEGEANDPKTLHKYLYAGSDPVNGRDPLGRDEDVDFFTSVWKAVIAVPTVGELAIDFVGCALGLADGAISMSKDEWPSLPGAAGIVIGCGLSELKSALYLAALL